MFEKNGINLYKANKLLEINRMLTQSLQLDEILQTVTKATSELVDVADVVIIYLYHEETQSLRFAKGMGIDEKALKLVSFAEGESITGKVFADQQSKLFTSQDEIELFMANMTEDNTRYYAEGVHQRNVKSTFCVPIINKDRCLGVVVVNNYKQDGVFTSTDMDVIEVVAGQSAIAIDNAKMYENLQQKNRQLEQSMSIHKVFYKLIIEGRGIGTVLTYLERMIGATVGFKEYLDMDEVQYSFPIQRGRDTLGCLSLVKPFEQFDEMERITIEQASSSIAIELIKENALYEKEIHFRQQVFDQLLKGVSGREIESALHYVNWQSDTYVQCLIIEGNKVPLWDTAQLMEKTQWIKSIEKLIRSKSIAPLVFARAFQLIVILPTSPAYPVEELITEISKIMSAMSNAICGIGREIPIKKLSISYEEATKSIGYAKRSGDTIVEYTELGVERLLYEVDQEVLERFMQDKLQGLQTADGLMMDTLEIFIRLNRNHKQIAEMLHIHPNTLYYRLKKAEDSLGIRFNNDKEWMNFVIAFHVFVDINE